MEANTATTLILPITLFIIMLGMGLSLTIKDFRNILLFPKAFFVGITSQLLLVPLVGALIVYVLGMKSEYALGVLLIALCPGGPASNLISYVSRANTALSISLTAVTSFVTVFTIPFFFTPAMNYFLAEEAQIILPLGETILRILTITVLPVSIGMLVNAKWHNFAINLEKKTKVFSTILFVVIALYVLVDNWDIILESFKTLGAASLLLNIGTMTLGASMALLFGLSQKNALTIAIETGIQNGALAIVIASTILGRPELSVIAGIYSLVMFATGGLCIYYFGFKYETKA